MLFNSVGEAVRRAQDVTLWGQVATAATADYAPPRQREDEDADPGLLYAGQWRDAESGLCYNRFRYYDPESGMYLVSDPLGLVGGLNQYAYVPNPLKYIDPLGLCKLLNDKGVLNNAEKAVIDPRKITEYALNPEHPVGKNKARVFESALGMNKTHADDLIAQIKQGVQDMPAIPGTVDQFGSRFSVDIPTVGPTGTATVRTGWIVKEGTDIPVLTTLFVK
ncbi:RHS repeat-associated core domain-containing protein [Salmonella enterica]|nr:RHS repeat-associated core domain-containing protein [Salmonella enterica]